MKPAQTTRCMPKEVPHCNPPLLIPAHDRLKNRQSARNALAGPLQKGLSWFLPALLIVGIWAAPAAAERDSPHNSAQNAACSSCHIPHPPMGTSIVPPDETCLTCHNGVIAPLVATHSSATTSTKYGDWAMSCKTCHKVHKKDQFLAYGPASFVVSGTSDPDGITTNSLTMTGAGWAENSLAGMVLFPNLAISDYYQYQIVGNSAETITVNGSMDLGVITDGNTNFGVIYGNLVRSIVTTPNSGPREVRMFRASGANSFADGDTIFDGICEVCHTQTSHHRNDGAAAEQSHQDGTRCTACHTHANGFGGLDHTAAGFVLPVSTCMECHGSLGSDLVGGVHGNQCGLCHADPAGAGPLVEPYESTLPQGGNCNDCHGSLSTAHQNIDHTAAPGSGPVVIFADTDHDDGGWVGAKPYFDVTVNCALCHNTDLPTIHGNDCATCHPTPYNTLGSWERGSQQGGCHSSYHDDATTAHLPFADANSIVNDCSRCHNPDWAVTQANCLNCHAAYLSGDVTPPVTTSNVQPEYDGPGTIGFSIMDNSKVGVGRTFYRLDGGNETAAGKELTITTSGPHQLEFWSMDQSGNSEAPPNLVSFTIYQDATPPTTTSNAKATYSQGAVITLTAADDGTRGVKTTFYRLGGGATQTGTTIVIPATTGTFAYTLDFWSEDWAGNIETPHHVEFTVTSGGGVLRLVWSNSDTGGSPCSGDPGAEAAWSIYRGNTRVAWGYGACPNWSGVNNVTVPVSATPYTVLIDWWDSYYEDWDQSRFPNIYVTAPGQVVRISY